METRCVLKKLISIVFVGIFCLAGVVRSAYAQEDEGAGVVYVVQPGDTLTFIGLRFGTTVEGIVEANNLSSDFLTVGMELVLPGVDWVEGVVDAHPVVYGETLRSTSRRYGLPEEMLTRLSRLTSPTQLYVDFPLLVPTQGDEEKGFERALITTGTSLLEQAVLSGENPWSVVAANRLEGTWAAMPGDVLLTVESSQEGPGALPPTIWALEFDSPRFVQGKTAVIRVQADESATLGGKLIDHELAFFPTGSGDYVALQGVHAMQAEGRYPLEIRVTLPEGETYRFVQLVTVEEGGYGFERLSVDPNLLDENLSMAESEEVESLVSVVNGEKLWEGLFETPSPNNDGINSFFGTRRSYNGDAYDSFHTGVDFGGGTGLPVYAAARGIVVFAEALEVRGLATIIDHGWGVYTAYYHQSEISVQVGDEVEAGEMIGVVGNSGRSSGAHLHWEVWVNGVQVEPLDWLVQAYP